MPGVTVRLAGSFAVGRDEHPVPVAGKARRLLMLLAAHRPRVLPVDLLVEALWGDRPPQRPERNVASLVSRLRGTLGPEVVAGGRDGYRLGAAPAVRVDLDEAGRLVEEASRRLADGAPGPADVAACAAVELLDSGGVLVDEPDLPWLAEVRDRGAALARQARHAAAAAALAVGDPDRARRSAGAAVAADRFDEAAQRLLMSAHRQAGAPARALAVYEDLRADLAGELGVDPAEPTRALHLAILREQPVAAELRVRTAPASGGSAPDLVGRSGELTRLDAAWSAAAAGRAGVLLLTGEGGIGKTRLAEETASLARSVGGQVLHTRCYASESSLFLQPFVDALDGPLTALSAGRLRELAGSRAAALAGLMPQLEPMLGRSEFGGDAEVERRRAYEAVARVLRGLAGDRPVLLVLDDLHNAGLATVELLHYLARHTAGARLLVLATLRVEEGEQALVALGEVTERIDVGPLDAAAVATLASGAGRGEQAATIMARTRGHTLFVVETLGALVAGVAEVSESLQAVVLARLRQAGPATEELLRAGAVLGATVDPSTVAGLLDLAPHLAARRCEQAAAARLLVATDRAYEFVNDLVQEVLYATTPAPTRCAHHRRAADLLAGSPEAAAGHAAAAGDWERAAQAFVGAAEAARRYAAADAAALAGRALDAATRAGEPALVARAHLTRASAATARAAYAPALDDQRAARSAAREAGDRRLEMRALRELGGHAAIALEVPIDEWTGWLTDGLRLAESLADRAMEARFRAWLAVIAGNRLRFDEGLAHALVAAEAGRACGDEAASAAGLDGLKNVYAYLGETASLSAVLDELEPLLRRLDDPELLPWTVFESAFPAIGAADWRLAEDRIGEAVTLAVRSGHTMFEGWFTALLGGVRRLRGRDDEALELGRRAVLLAARVPHRWFGPVATAELATTLIELGRTAEAARLLTDSGAGVDWRGAEAPQLRHLAPLAEATGSAATLAAADALLGRITAPPGSAWLLGTDYYLAVARSWLRRGEPARARSVLVPLLIAARRQNWLPALAGAGLVDASAAAALGEVAAARSALSAVAELAARHGMPRFERDARAALDTTR